MDHYDLIVIGSGPAGFHAALQARELDRRVLVVERRPLLGGTSIHTGTVPSKALREAALYLSGFRQRAFYGVEYRLDEDITFADLSPRVEKVIRNETALVTEQLRHRGAAVAHGAASLVDAHTVRIDGEHGRREVAGDFLMIAPGSRPAHSPDIPIDGIHVIDTDQVLGLEHVPKSLAVLGGGVIGMEYASIVAALGVPVTLIDSRRVLLEFADDECVEHLVDHLTRIGVRFHLGTNVKEVEHPATGGVLLHLEDGAEVAAEVLLYAVGRQANTDGLGLGSAGLTADKYGRLQVNEWYQTAVPHIYAAGDVIGFPALASVSMDQGRIAACHMFQHECNALEQLTPFGIYTVPEISFVGKTEEELVRDGVPHQVLRSHYRETARGQIIGDTSGMLKLIFDPASRRILGVHVVGEGASELVHVGQAVMALGGTLDYFIDHAFNYPTLAQAYKNAALSADDPEWLRPSRD